MTKPRRVPETDRDNFVAVYCDDRKVMPTTSNHNRGIFRDLESGDVIAQGPPFPVEYASTPTQGLPAPTDMVHYIPYGRCRITLAVEGTAMVVFYHKDQWYLSTCRKLDAFSSYWADPTSSFGMSFAKGVFYQLGMTEDLELTDQEAVRDRLTKVFDTHLDRSMRYTFIQPPSFAERMVTVPNQTYQVPVHVASYRYDKSTLTRVDDKVPFAAQPVTYQIPPGCTHPYNYICMLASRVDPYKAQGILIELPDGDCIKVLQSTYHQLRTLRSSTPSLRGRYIQLRHDPYQLAQFVTYYPEVNGTRIESDIREICRIVDTLHKVLSGQVSLDDIGTVVESPELSKALIQNLVNNVKYVSDALKYITPDARPYDTMYEMSIHNTKVYNALAKTVRFHLTRARRAIEEVIDSEIALLEELDNCRP